MIYLKRGGKVMIGNKRGMEILSLLIYAILGIITVTLVLAWVVPSLKSSGGTLSKIGSYYFEKSPSVLVDLFDENIVNEDYLSALKIYNKLIALGKDNVATKEDLLLLSPEVLVLCEDQLIGPKGSYKNSYVDKNPFKTGFDSAKKNLLSDDDGSIKQDKLTEFKTNRVYKRECTKVALGLYNNLKISGTDIGNHLKLYIDE